MLDLIRRGRCADCGLADPLVLEFDHLEQKRADVARLVHEGYALGQIQAEVAKCELVCANCHRRRTDRRVASWRTNPERVEALGRHLRSRNLRYVLDHLCSACCVDCREHDVIVLEFDHVASKRASVLELAMNECSLTSIEREINECEVRCANCHRRRTIRLDPTHLRHRLLSQREQG